MATSVSDIPPTEYMSHNSLKINIKEKNLEVTEGSLSKDMESISVGDDLVVKQPTLTEKDQQEFQEGKDNFNSTSKTVQFDPIPTSRTIYKSTSTPSKLHNGSAMSSTSTHTAQNGVQSLPCSATELYNQTKAGLGTPAAIPRRYPLLPADCREKYNRYTYLPGVKSIPSNTLEWKVPLMQKKNKMAIDDYLSTLFVEQQKKDAERRLRDQERIERERVEAAPEWKRPLVRVREEKRKMDQMLRHQQMEKDKEEMTRFKSLPPWQQELILRKREQQRLDQLPEWQKDLITKKKVANNRKSFERN